MKKEKKVKNLKGVVDILHSNLTKKEKVIIEKAEDMSEFHHGYGTWIRNNFGLWKDSDLAKWFISRGVDHADDMSGIILDALHKKCKGEEYTEEDFLEEKAEYDKHWNSMKTTKE